jgi:hypothetical protein
VMRHVVHSSGLFLANEATVKRVSGFELRGFRQKKTLKFGPKQSQAHHEK